MSKKMSESRGNANMPKITDISVIKPLVHHKQQKERVAN